jgi:transposase
MQQKIQKLKKQMSFENLAQAFLTLQSKYELVQSERDQLRCAHEQLRLELELLKRRIFVAQAERVDTAQLELEFAAKLKELDQLSGLADDHENPHSGEGQSQKAPKKRHKPTGRRDLKKANLPEERIEITDPLFEELVKQGKAQAIGFEESSKLAYQRGGMRRVVIARVKYRATTSQGESTIETAERPKQCFPKSMAAPSMLAHIAMAKHCDGLPLFRIESQTARDGFRLDRSTMCRWLEDLGATLGATVVEAIRNEVMKTAFCLATDATGILVQPEPLANGKRQPCRKAHFFVLIADRDHIFFEYTPKETSAIVAEMFKGYSGYVQADAKSVYDILFRKPHENPPDELSRQEVGCWYHCRRKFWEATVAKSVVAREGLARIGRLFKVDAMVKGKPPDEIKRFRQAHLDPQMDAFFVWAKQEYEKVKDQRGLLRSALGYALRQQEALMRVLDDGRLVMDNNRSERELRRIAVGRKAWLFVGSDDHGTSAGNLFSMIASAQMHGLDPELYLRDIIRVLAYWPKERYLELAPKYWAKTRARLEPNELAKEVGLLTVPEPTK